MSEKNSLEWVKEHINYITINPEYVANNMLKFSPRWLDALHTIMNYMIGISDGALDAPEEDINAIFKQGFILLPGIIMYEDTNEAFEAYSALCLLLYNYGIQIHDEEMLRLYEADAILTRTREDLKSLLLVTESLILQIQAYKINNNADEPYRLSREFLDALTGKNKEEDNNA